MDNTRKCDDKYVKRVFDLKGSIIKREVKGKLNQIKNVNALKDVNFLNFKKEEKFLRFSEI
jgi:hypothetical protein